MSLRRNAKSQGKVKLHLKRRSFESLPQDEGENPFASAITNPGTLVSPSAASSANSNPFKLLSASSETHMHSGCLRQDEEVDGEATQSSDGPRSKKDSERTMKDAKKERKEAEKQEMEQKQAEKTLKSKRDSTSSQTLIPASQDRQSLASPHGSVLLSSPQSHSSNEHTALEGLPENEVLDSKQQCDSDPDVEPKGKPTHLQPLSQFVSKTIRRMCWWLSTGIRLQRVYKSKPT